ncbi:growth/differentiation factor 9 [Ranitomeya imitator]|uniref:growth/differentiation factor 9 n=1 Tax=Ranitomeya imitator TaxID=111125 RepID=UPI0037E7C2FF
MAGAPLVIILYYSTWLLTLSASDSGLVYDTQAFKLLPPLFKELSERPGWREGTSVPQSVAIKYMKKLYKMSATKEGVPRVHRNAEYNTVRLFPPKNECKAVSKLETKGHKYLDVTYNVDSVSLLEQNLRSVLLYSVNKQYSSSNITCICALEITAGEVTNPTCPGVPQAFEFQLRNRQRWVEIDVTAFLQPLISSRQIINLSVNLTCLWNKHHHIFGITGPLQLTRSPPCLLLYLNDTSNMAYHRRKMHVEPLTFSIVPILSHLNELPESIPATKVSRHRRGQDVETNSPTVELMPYNFSKFLREFVYHQNECELHKFRLSFSQLNWDKWILAPHRYSPDYCKGDCPRVVGQKYGSPVHTIVQNIIYEKVDSSIPRPSCVPSQYRPMSVLTIEPDNSIAYKEYQDMIATRCTCR